MTDKEMSMTNVEMNKLLENKQFDWYVLKELRNQTDEPMNEWIVTFDFPKEVQNDR